jgi:hypothetical protein
MPKVAATETTGGEYPVAKGLSEGQYHYTTPALLKIGRDLGNALVKLCGLGNDSGKVSADSGQTRPPAK